jgi:hypothetical protein
MQRLTDPPCHRTLLASLFLQKLPCTFLLDVEGLGYLDGGSGNDVGLPYSLTGEQRADADLAPLPPRRSRSSPRSRFPSGWPRRSPSSACCSLAQLYLLPTEGSLHPVRSDGAASSSASPSPRPSRRGFGTRSTPRPTRSSSPISSAGLACGTALVAV